MKTIFCKNGCCNLFYTEKDIREPEKFLLDTQKRLKAGVLLFDKITGKVLVSQSYNSCWGFPKGSRETFDPSAMHAAIRELSEETGVYASKSIFVTEISFRFKGLNYTFFLGATNGELKTRNPDLNLNESTGVGWIKPSCLLSSDIRLNKISQMLIRKSPEIRVRS